MFKKTRKPPWKGLDYTEADLSNNVSMNQSTASMIVSVYHQGLGTIWGYSLPI